MTPDEAIRHPDMRETWNRIKALSIAAADLHRQRLEIDQKTREVHEKIRELQMFYRAEYNRRTTEGTKSQ